ncbi:MAG: alpha-mannosidase, partial [Clostridia bacterium]|nr:alpha-mannosidase [Clostridia bacterium]
AHEYIWEKGFRGQWAKDAVNANIQCIGHSHIDVAWMWRICQTREKAQRTFVNALNLIDTDDEFMFFCSQPAVYNFVKEDDPVLFERVRAAVKAGRWEADGGMWVEADCNLTSGEGFVRQFLYGTRFYEEEFGKKCKMLWLPDVFGYSAALPQILRGFDLSYFTTAKINNNEYNCMPHDTFVWKGIDGSEVFTHLICGTSCSQHLRGEFSTTYNTELGPQFVNGTWQHYHDKDLTDEVFLPVGWGDGGGGPAEYMVEFGKRISAGLPNSVRSSWGSVGDWFDKWSSRLEGKKYLPVWDGELYFERHRGTLTSMARIKKKNRKAENLYQKAEWLSVLAGEMAGAEFDKERIDTGWKMLLTNQFHDILPGSSVREVYEDADRDYETIFEIGNSIFANAADSLAENISGKKGDIIVFNPSGIDRNDSVTVETAATGICGATTQRTADGKLCFNAKVPAKGWAVFSPCGEVSEGKTAKFDGTVLDTPYWTITLASDGSFASVYDKENGREVLNGNATRLVAYEDLPMYDDAWDINEFYPRKSYETKLVSCELIENGAVYAVLRQTRTFNRSTIIQDIKVYSSEPRIDFVTTADWKEKSILLKAHFPVAVNTDTATYDIQFGSVTRNTHKNTSWDFAKFEVCGHKWADVSDNGYGAAVLNDCKYGYSADGSELALSLIKSAIFPNENADREVHNFSYSFLPHAGTLADSEVIKNGYLLNVPCETRVKDNDGGNLAPQFSLVSVESGSAIIEAVKPAENGDGAIIRIYEPRGRRTKAEIRLDSMIAAVEKTNLKEEACEAVELKDNKVTLNMGAFEIVTLRVRFAD